MQKILLLLVLVLVGLRPLAAQGVQWTDPVGDARKMSGTTQPQLDITNVSVEGNGTELVITIRVAGSFDPYFRHVERDGRKRGGVLADFYVDTDNNGATGGTSMFAGDAPRPFGGYDYSLSVLLGYTVPGPGGKPMPYTGDVVIAKEDAARAQPAASVSRTKFRQGGSLPEPGSRIPRGEDEAVDKSISLSGNTFSVKIPYAWFGLTPGSVMRLCYDDQPPFLKGLSEDRILKVR